LAFQTGCESQRTTIGSNNNTLSFRPKGIRFLIDPLEGGFHPVLGQIPKRMMTPVVLGNQRLHSTMAGTK
jgi:hypothetical protein